MRNDSILVVSTTKNNIKQISLRTIASIRCVTLAIVFRDIVMWDSIRMWFERSCVQMNAICLRMNWITDLKCAKKDRIYLMYWNYHFLLSIDDDAEVEKKFFNTNCPLVEFRIYLAAGKNLALFVCWSYFFLVTWFGSVDFHNFFSSPCTSNTQCYVQFCKGKTIIRLMNNKNLSHWKQTFINIFIDFI